MTATAVPRRRTRRRRRTLDAVLDAASWAVLLAFVCLMGVLGAVYLGGW